jgi:hypothetical protein
MKARPVQVYEHEEWLPLDQELQEKEPVKIPVRFETVKGSFVTS